MSYKKVEIKINPPDNIAREILIAQLSELGYESFMETDDGLEAYIPADIISPLTPQNITFLDSSDYSFNIRTEDLEEKDWNEEWEKNYFKPIVIGNQCLIRSPFHKSPAKTRYEILIEPRMAFGTGYHETTSLMIEHLLEMNIKNKHILDMGCGTGILGILASMLGASGITGIDIDHWAVNNAKDNLLLNNISNMDILLGDASQLISSHKYDVVLANINRNILLEDMEKYDRATKKEGTILLSGFYKQDIEKIDAQAEKVNWTKVLTKEQNNWVAISYRKQ